MAAGKLTETDRLFIEKRAEYRCEYCKAPAVFSPHPCTIDHIIPLKRGGETQLQNLAYACFGCNRHKYYKTYAVDPFSQQEILLFNPRIHSWKDHFTWDDDLTQVLGLTAIGRATVLQLKLNRPALLRMRQELIEINRHPPE